MSKGIELTPTQIKAYENGATMFLFPIDRIKNPNINDFLDNLYSFNCIDGINNFIEDNFSIQKGDKDIFVQEEFVYHFDPTSQICGDIYYRAKEPDIMSIWQPASQMTKEQSRYSFSECVDVIIIKVKDIPTYNIWKVMPRSYQKEGGYVIDTFSKFYNQQMKEQNINRTYEDNDYVFLIEFA